MPPDDTQGHPKIDIKDNCRCGYELIAGSISSDTAVLCRFAIVLQ